MAINYRAEIIGSLLRPAYLKEARRAWEAGQLSTLEFKRSEDRAVNAAIALQEEAGLDIITDGEMRRALFTGTLTEAIEGISPAPGQPWHWFGPTPADEMDYQPPVSVTGRIRRRRSLATEEFAYARGQAHKPLKITLPSPMMLFFAWSPEHSKAAYKDPFELFADATDILRQEVHELSALGCQYIQIDAPEVATLVDDFQRRTGGSRRIQTQIQDTLPLDQVLAGVGLERLNPRLIMGRAKVLDVARAGPKRPHDLHRGRTRTGLQRPHIRHRRTLRTLASLSAVVITDLGPNMTGWTMSSFF